MRVAPQLSPLDNAWGERDGIQIDSLRLTATLANSSECDAHTHLQST